MCLSTAIQKNNETWSAVQTGKQKPHIRYLKFLNILDVENSSWY